VPLTPFISYAHEDRSFKDTLLIHLAVLMRRHLIESWDDSLIEVGSDWRAAIEKALDTCNLALLLVSPDFLASEFIHSVELKRVLDRREREGIRVVPIILRPCLWTSEPIGTLQALPEDGTPIITFPPETGARDQAWTDIVRKLAQWAEEDRKRYWGETRDLGRMMTRQLLKWPNPATL
jgi:hypothetical protein